MTLVSFKVDTKPLEKRLRSLQKQIGESTGLATLEALQHIHKQAMINLNENLEWGHGVNPSPKAESEQIEESVDMHLEPSPNGIRGVLTYNSPHAQLQEYGAMYLYESERPMPIGLREGHIEGFGYKIAGVIQGKYFLTRAYMTEESSVREIFEKYLQQTIAGGGI